MAAPLEFSGLIFMETSPAGSANTRMTQSQKILLALKIVEFRLRFIVVMVVTGLVFVYWDEIWNRYEKWRRPVAVTTQSVSGNEFYCPMHPQVVQAERGNCPICGMPLASRKKGDRVGPGPGSLSRVELSPHRVAQAGVQTAEVSYAPLKQTFATVGSVAFDERRLANITSRVPGKTRVEKLYVNFTGQGVEVGQTLAELYSPELSQAIQELLSASRRSNLGNTSQTDAGRLLLNDRQEMLRSSIEKLRRWGVTDEQILEILKSGKNDFKFPILSPIRGNIVRKNVVEGQEIPDGFPMFEVADLHTVWVKAQVFERQLGLIRLGQPVEARVEAFPGELFPGQVEFIQPNVDPSTRTVEVRYALDNPGLRLRPGMFTTVVLETPIAETPEFQKRYAKRGAPGSLKRLGQMTVEEQRICPVTDEELGTMGPSVAVKVQGKTIWTCCDACPPKLNIEPEKYLAKLTSLLISSHPEADATATLARQQVCPVTGAKLGSMGEPILVELGEQKVYACCAACVPQLKADPEKYLARLVAPNNQVLSVPESAVIDTGVLKVVYVEVKPGIFEGRAVVLGPRTGDRYPVLDGVNAGERIAVSGAFLIDAESRIMTGGSASVPEPDLNQELATADLPLQKQPPESSSSHSAVPMQH